MSKEYVEYMQKRFENVEMNEEEKTLTVLCSTHHGSMKTRTLR